jgi:3',5'-cyclic AMP phosphodiesterase CpdA
VLYHILTLKGVKKPEGVTMSEITILHLSDIHFKKNKEEKKESFHQTVQQRLIEAVATHNREHGSPDVVAVTGDIAFSGKEHEYKEAAVFFDQLKGVLPEGTEFLAVPGNHDVDRDEVDKFFSRLIKGLSMD